jgi:hypothetical protein
MTLFYFHFRSSGRHWMPDPCGTRLPSRAAAEAEARRAAREMAQGDDGDRWRGWRVEVADEDGAVLTQVPVFDRLSYH